jgi:pilus assembly protein Flp/PilA
MRGMLRRLREEERGASLVEYALLVALIAVVCIAAVTFLGSSGSGQLDRAGTAVAGEDEDRECIDFQVGQGHGGDAEGWVHQFRDEGDANGHYPIHPGRCP